jgi:hypothetical protein
VSASAVVWVTEDLRVGVDVFQGTEAVLRVRDRVRELARQFTIRELRYDPPSSRCTSNSAPRRTPYSWTATRCAPWRSR